MVGLKPKVNTSISFPIAPIPEAQFVMSTKGSPQLCVDGFTFTRHIVKDDTIYWRCTQFRALR